ncbi:hypothetical protein SAMN06295967_11480 [Belliella buryatensis]|uniref:Uncharacterized protein n=1 Tax=Belliella buryatensis TaxID=1500549 RepID=A0A239G2H2_9BACT|nr:hypothetical protein [Belliella buryatensis]SNS63155.1 hypothetical protein SAMN06295967_11480 [Belliella buryatensis]
MTELSEQEIIKFLKEKRKSLITEIEKIDTALKAMEGVGFVNLPRSIIKSDESFIPDQYSDKLKLDKKILFALKEMGKGDKSEIIQKIQQLEPKSDISKLENSISVRLSYLKNNNIVKADKNGRSLSYYL